MSVRGESHQLAWLLATLGESRSRIAGLLGKLSGLGASALKPALFKKFLGFLDQVARERDEELHLINRIEMIESKHRHLRKHHRLEHADVDYVPESPDCFERFECDDDEDEDDAEWKEYRREKRMEEFWKKFRLWMNPKAEEF